ncbi:hypothetical protein [Spiroplasma endosymbiont of Stenodema calcarata]|uniref:hypothetical protein n=1 Tax=Spiroplasma endosymbiont of Stenodema calcarata TaxID=3139328 RepID=UPI003CCAE7C6
MENIIILITKSIFSKILKNYFIHNKLKLLYSGSFHLLFNVHLINTINNTNNIKEIINEYLDFFELKNKNPNEIIISNCLINIYSNLEYFKKKNTKLKNKYKQYFLPNNILIFFEIMNKIINNILFIPSHKTKFLKNIINDADKNWKVKLLNINELTKQELFDLSEKN